MERGFIGNIEKNKGTLKNELGKKVDLRTCPVSHRQNDIQRAADSAAGKG